MAVLDRLGNFLFETPKRKLIAALLALTFVKTSVPSPVWSPPP
jgi:hypothetical protein